MRPSPRIFYTTQEILAMFKIGRSTFYRWRKAGIVSNGLHMGPRKLVWAAEEIDELEASIKVGEGLVPTSWANGYNASATTGAAPVKSGSDVYARFLRSASMRQRRPDGSFTA